MFSLNGHIFFEAHERALPAPEVGAHDRRADEAVPIPPGCCGKIRRTGVCCGKYLRRKDKKAG